MLGQSPRLSFEPGTLLAGRYEVVRFLSAGGMGSVVLVRDRTLQNAKLVLKFLHIGAEFDEQQFLRFQNEALLMRELNHPHIVSIYDFGCIEEQFYYLSMEYVQGMTLGQLIRENPDGYHFKQSLEILYQLAVALSFAHARGIIHRDLKPDNVLIDMDGDVRVTDFGLGKAVQADLSLTDTGQAVGTPHYMAPEQLRGEPSVFATDIYAFGLVAYELVTGKKAFNADTYLMLAQMHLRKPIPSFAGKASGIPRWFQTFVETCAAKTTAARFHDFGEITDILAEHIPSTKRSLSLEPTVLPSSRRGSRWRLPWRLRKPRTLVSLIVAFLLLSMTTVLVLVGRNNQEIRVLYAPFYYQLEKRLGIDSRLLRVTFLGDNHEDARYDERTLIEAIEQENPRPEDVHLMLLGGMSPNIRTPEGQTMVQLAVSKGVARVIPLLAQYGADFTVEDDERRNLLILAATVGSPDLVAAVLPYVTAAGISIDSRDRTRKTALHYVIERADIASVDLLLREGASAHLLDERGTSPLMYAAATGRADIVDRILTKTGSGGINLANENGLTPLHFAVGSKSLEATKLLMNYGADPHLQTVFEQTPSELARQLKREEILRVFEGTK